MTVTIGQTAPDFSLFNQDKKEVRLFDLKGKTVLLLFFPLAFTSVCTKELCSVRDDIGFYNDTNAEVFGISVDSLHTLNKFKTEQNLNFNLLSDFNKNVSTAYGALYETFGYNMKGVSKRAAFVIDRDQVIRYAEVLENAGEVPNFPEIRAVIEKLR